MADGNALEKVEVVPDTPIIDGVSWQETTMSRSLAKVEDPFVHIKPVTRKDKAEARRLIKRYQGDSGAHAKYLTIEQINGYMLYRLAWPPYNLDYLNFLATEDPTHHACIMTKAYNIVGAGYMWKETKKVEMMRQDAMQTDQYNKRLQSYNTQVMMNQHEADEATAASKVSPLTGMRTTKVQPKPVPKPTPESMDQKVQKLAAKLIRAQLNLEETIESLNQEDPFLETLLKVWIDVESIGNGYIEIGRNNDGSIGYVGYIPAYTMRVRIDRDGFVQWVLPGYVGPQPMGLQGPYPGLTFFRNFGDTTTPDIFGKDPRPNEILHIKKHTAKSVYYGIPDIVPALASVVGDRYAREYNLDYFENKAVPRYALIVKGAKLSAQAEKKILDYFRKEVKGRHHGTLYIPVPASIGGTVDVKLEAIEADMQDGSFSEYRMVNRGEIAMCHRVPITKLGAGGGGGGGSAGHQAQGREDSKNFDEALVGPEKRRFEYKINRIIEEFTDMFKFKFNEYQIDDKDTISRIQDRNIRNGQDSPNEARIERGKLPRPGGDEYLNPTQQAIGDANLNITGATEMGGSSAANGPNSNTDTTVPGSGNPGRPRQTTDGSPKNANPSRSPVRPVNRASQGSKGGQSTPLPTNRR